MTLRRVLFTLGKLAGIAAAGLVAVVLTAWVVAWVTTLFPAVEP